MGNAVSVHSQVGLRLEPLLPKPHVSRLSLNSVLDNQIQIFGLDDPDMIYLKGFLQTRTILGKAARYTLMYGTSSASICSYYKPVIYNYHITIF